MLLPVLSLLVACGGPGKIAEQQLEVSFAETEISAEAGSVFVRVISDASWTLEIVPAVDWAALNTNAGSGSKNSILLTCQANPEADARTLTVVATTAGGKKTATAALTQRGYVAPTAPSVNRADGGTEASAPYKWLELPATSATDGLDFYWRMAELDGKTVRNYSFYWNYTDRVSMWVAYPLCKMYLGSQGRSEAWGYDPLLPASKQQNVSGGYKEGNNGWYARGHQLPSADRTATYALNTTTFYGTNMTPQNNDFNGGIWARLEGKVRDWAEQSDTLYVVTGCVVDGAKYYALDRSGEKITVPTAYFKAVLRYSKSTTISESGFNSAAFWFEHQNYTNSASILKVQSMSVSELEAKLGYTLFVNLPDRVGTATAASIKSEKPASLGWWW